MSSCLFCHVKPERPGVACDTCCDERLVLEARFQGRWYRAAQAPVAEGRVFVLDAATGARILPRFVLSEVRDRSPRFGSPSMEHRAPVRLERPDEGHELP